MESFELTLKRKQKINGILSQYMDAYIRQNKVWTPQQMLESFCEKTENDIQNNNPIINLPASMLQNIKERQQLNKWLLLEEGKLLALQMFQNKYQKDKPVAGRKSPIVERVRFGFKWDKNKYYDINFGLKDEHRFISTKELEYLDIVPWNIEHVNQELDLKYNKIDLISCYKNLCTSHLEQLFYKHWVNNFYEENQNPALIPEVCGLREQFYYYEINDEIFSNLSELPEKYKKNSIGLKSKNFRYDFLLINFKRQKIAFIELDGFENHKTRKQQSVDSIKRNTASKKGIVLLNFTSKRIIENIDNVFKELELFLV